MPVTDSLVEISSEAELAALLGAQTGEETLEEPESYDGPQYAERSYHG